MASSSAVFGKTKQPSKFRYPKTFPIIDGVQYLPGTTRDFLQDLKRLPVKGDEVMVVSFPKSGSTWVSEIVWQISKAGSIDMKPIHHRVPLLESLKSFDKINTKERLLDFFSNMPFPRVFKTHLQYPLAPMGDGVTTPKYINVIRNPKDSAVSFYHQVKSLEWTKFDGEWGELFETFIDGEVTFGSWFDHVLGWWAHRHDPNILTLKYEDLKKDLPSAVSQIARFLNRDLPEQTIQLIVKQTTFDAMSQCSHLHDDELERNVYTRKPGAMRFLRKGEVGDWKNYFTEEQNQRFDELYERKMAGSGLELDFS